MQNGGNGKQPVLITTGMHRSGTSLTASLLQSAGLDVGQNLLEASSSNPKGHFENLDFFTFHQDVLRSSGTSDAGWTVQKEINIPEYYIDKARLLIQKNASLTRPWGWKDPRTTLFLNFWGNLIPDAKFLFLYRSPWEVLDSLYRRGDVEFHHNPSFALDIWMNYNQIILDFHNRFPEKCLLVHLQQVIDDPTAFVKLLSQRLSLPLSVPTENLYDASLLVTEVSSSQRAMLIQRSFPDAYMLYQQLNTTAGFSEDSTCFNQELFSPTAWLLKDWLDLRSLQRQFREQVTNLQGQLSLTQANLESANQLRQTLQTENQTLQTENQAFQDSLYTLKESHAQFKQQLEWQLEHKQAEIEAMKTSKFWKLRSQWFKFKRIFRPEQ